MAISSDTNKSGYSLFEVLVAFTIMSIVLSVLVPGQALIMSRTAKINNTISATDLGLSRMALLRAGPVPSPGESVHESGAYRVVQKVETGLSSHSTNHLNLLIVVENLDQEELIRISGIRMLPE